MSLATGHEPGGSDVSEDLLAKFAERYAKARDEIAEATARKDEARNRLLEIAGGPGKLKAGGYVVTISQQNRVTLDSKALREFAEQSGIDLTPFEKSSTSMVVRVV